MSAEKIASQAYLEVAVDHGVDYVFGLPGTSGQEFIGTIADQEKSASCWRFTRPAWSPWRTATPGSPAGLAGAGEHASGFGQFRRRALRRLPRSFACDIDFDSRRHAHRWARFPHRGQRFGRNDQAVHQMERRSPSLRPHSRVLESRVQSRRDAAHRPGLSIAAQQSARRKHRSAKSRGRTFARHAAHRRRSRSAGGGGQNARQAQKDRSSSPAAASPSRAASRN